MSKTTYKRTAFLGAHRYDVNASDTAIRIRSDRQETPVAVVVGGSAAEQLTAELARVRPIRRRRYWHRLAIGIGAAGLGAFVVAEASALLAELLWGADFGRAFRVIGFLAGFVVGPMLAHVMAGDRLHLPEPGFDGLTLTGEDGSQLWYELTPAVRDQLLTLDSQPADVQRAGIDIIVQRAKDARNADHERQARESRDRAKELRDRAKALIDSDSDIDTVSGA